MKIYAYNYILVKKEKPMRLTKNIKLFKQILSLKNWNGACVILTEYNWSLLLLNALVECLRKLPGEEHFAESDDFFQHLKSCIVKNFILFILIMNYTNNFFINVIKTNFKSLSEKYNFSIWNTFICREKIMKCVFKLSLK